MKAFEKPRAERSMLPKLICPADPKPAPAEARTATTRLANRMGRLAQRLAAVIGAWQARRRARRRLESWLTMDRRVLADIGLRHADIQAMVYGGAAGARLADRGGRWAALPAETVVEARRRVPPLRVVAGHDLDAAA